MKNRPSKFLKGFKYAFRGLIHCINNERNMRFHTAVMLYVLVFSPFFTLSKTQYVVLIITISSVISAEMLNTAAEELADLSAADYNPLARAAKDIAAGAVLVCAFFSVVVGIILLWQPDAFVRIYEFFLAKPWCFALALAATALIIVYVAKGPLWIRRACAHWIGKARKR